MNNKRQILDDDEDEPSVQVEYRFSHDDGIAAIDCFQDATEEKLITCGGNGEVWVWKSFDDEDPVAHTLTDNGLTLKVRNEQVYVGTEYNTIETLSWKDGKNLGVKTKFTAAVNHIDISKDGKWLVAGSGDMTIQIINLENSSVPPTKLETHSSPVLSVAMDPLNKFLASSGCDGNVCVWSLTDEGKPVHLVKKFERVFPTSNDISTSITLCRISWESNGKILAVPEQEHVALYTRESWTKLKVYKFQKSKKMASVTKFSSCGTYLAAGNIDGTLIVWAVKDATVIVEHSRFEDQITDIVFANNTQDIIAVDKKGRVLLLKDFKVPPAPAKSIDLHKKSQVFDSDVDDDPMSPPNPSMEPNDDQFDDGMDDLFADDDNEFSISKIKAETGFVGEEYVGVAKAKQVIIGGELGEKKRLEDDDAVSVSSAGSRSVVSRPVAPPQKIIIPFTEPQTAFQPGSTPVHLEHRFMIWNNTGIIRNYSHDDDEKDAIDIEFHDAAVHHAVHLRNQFDYTIATLTKEVAVFANEKQIDSGSKIFCYAFTSWDSKKEWSTDLPLGEEIIGVASGDGWIAASTDMNRIRIFTISGAQKQIIDIGGQVITTCAHEDLLFITFHNGIGLHGNQCIAYSIFRIKPSLKPFPLVSCEPLPVSPKSQVSWIGFTDEGTPATSDSKNILRILNGRYWTTFCNMKDDLSNSSDHFWVTGVSELTQRIRAVKCKGMKHPPTLPRPVLMQLDAHIPFCEMDTEKSRLEDRFHRSLMLDSLSKKMEKKNFEVDEYKTQAEKELKESLFNLFVLSCKGDWDARGTDYVSMMPSAHAVQVAVKYASKLRKKGLVDRLTAIGRRKLDEEDLEVEGDDDDFETIKMGTVVYSRVQNKTFASSADYSASQDLFADSSNRFNTSTSASFSNSFSTPQISRPVVEVPDEENPFLKRNIDEIRKLMGSSDTPTNRFRKEKPVESSVDNSDTRGLNVIDSWKKPSEKPTDLFAKSLNKNTKGGRKGSDKDKNKEQQPNNKEKKKQTTLFDMHGKKNKDKNYSNPGSPIVVEDESNDHESSPSLLENSGVTRNSESLLDCTNIQHERSEEVPKKKTGYLLWFDENKHDLQQKHPDVPTPELIKIGMPFYKQLSKEDKQKYLNPIGNANQTNHEEKKRKRNDTDDEECYKEDSEKKTKVSSKLAAFVRVE